MKGFNNGTKIPQKNESDKFQTSQFLITKDAAIYISVSHNYLHQLMFKKQIGYYKPNGKTCYFSIEDLNAWIQRNRVSSTLELSAKSLSYLNP